MDAFLSTGCADRFHSVTRPRATVRAVRRIDFISILNDWDPPIADFSIFSFITARIMDVVGKSRGKGACPGRQSQENPIRSGASHESNDNLLREKVAET